MEMKKVIIEMIDRIPGGRSAVLDSYVLPKVN